MNRRVIELKDWRHLDQNSSAPAPIDTVLLPEGSALVDQWRRPLTDLRISVTDRCNFRCTYCMPDDAFGRDHPFIAHDELLRFEDITRLARLFVRRGVRKLKLTGGEPLMRRDFSRLVSMLAPLRTLDGDAVELTLTTNGSLLARHAVALKQAGLTRVTISLDAIDDGVFGQINGVGTPVAEVMAGLDAALSAGFGPIKVNMVVKKGLNDHQVLPMAEYFRVHHGDTVVLRFIEFMDVGCTNGWNLEQVVPSQQVWQQLHARWPLVRLPAQSQGETAVRWRYADGRGEVGFVSSVSEPFCGDCSRARLSTDGQLFLCLFAQQGHDLRALLPTTDDEIDRVLTALWTRRNDQYSRQRQAQDTAGRQTRQEMHYIGG